MRRVHGEYPFDDGPWKGAWTYLLQKVPKTVVDAFLAEVLPVDDDQGELPNKGFRAVRSEYLHRGKGSDWGQNVLAVYKHDDEYHLITAREDFFEMLDAQRWPGGKATYQTPVERLPYPTL